MGLCERWKHFFEKRERNVYFIPKNEESENTDEDGARRRLVTREGRVVEVSAPPERETR